MGQDHLLYSFTTAWRIPRKIYEKLSSVFPEIRVFVSVGGQTETPLRLHYLEGGLVSEYRMDDALETHEQFIESLPSEIAGFSAEDDMVRGLTRRFLSLPFRHQIVIAKNVGLLTDADMTFSDEELVRAIFGRAALAGVFERLREETDKPGWSWPISG